MQPFIARVRAFFAPRFDASTGQRRRRTLPAVAAGAVLALLLGSGAAVAVASSAEAHNWTVDATCSTLSVNLTYYNTNNGGTNTVTVTVDGTAVLPTQNFTTGFSQVFTLAPGVAHTYSVVVTAHDDPDATKNWAFTKTGTTTPCATPTVSSLTPSVCSTPGGTADLLANFTGLDQSHTYTVALSSVGGTNVAAAPFTATGATGSKTFTGIIPGVSYTVTIVDTTAQLSGSASVYAVGCPQDSALQVSATECAAAGGAGQFGVTASSLVNGRAYTIALINAAGDVQQDSVTFTADASGTTTRTFSVPPSGSYYAVITDVVATTSKTSNTITFLPCPGTPGQPTLEVTQCNAVPTDGLAAFAVAGGTIGLTVTGLVPGRTYDIVITDAANTEVLSVKNFLATSSTYTADATGLAEGVYTAKVTDVLVPSYTASQTTTLLPCPTYDTTITLSATECTEPGQELDLDATIADYAAGRSYTVVLLHNNAQVGASKTFDSSTGTPQVVSFTGLTPGFEYTVKVTDDAANPAVTAAETITLGTCPGQPTLSLSAGECTVIGVTDIIAQLADLEIGTDYVVSLTSTATGLPVTGIDDVTFTATAATKTVTFADVPNDADYTVTVEAAEGTLSASDTIVLEICDPPTFPLPPETPPVLVVPTLALTGSSPMGAALIGAVLLFQAGLALVGVALLRRRSNEV